MSVPDWPLLAELAEWRTARQILVLAFVALATTLVLRWVRSRHAQRSSVGNAVPAPHPLAVRLLAPAIAAVFAILAYLLLRAFSLPAALVFNVAALAALLVLVRAALYALVRFVLNGPFVRAAEQFLAWIAWVVIAMAYLRWLEPALRAADSVALPVINSHVSLLDAIQFILLLLVLIVIAAYLGALTERRLMAAEHISVGIKVVTAKVARVAFVVIAGLVAFSAAGLNLTTLTVIGGALSVGIGFGLQRIASNFVSGFILLADRSIRPGDVITVGTRFGVVRELRARYVVVRDRDGVDTLLPNESIVTSEVINWSYADRNIRLKLPLNISYHDNPRAAMELMMQAAQEHPRVERSPSPAARIIQFGENGIELELRFWIRDPEDGVHNVRSDLYLAIWDSFKRAGITFPFPQRQLHLSGELAAMAAKAVAPTRERL